MKKIVLISCVSKKLNYRSRAEDLYISPLFKKNLSYAKKISPDKIFILSAEYGLLELDDEIEPYNKTLNKMSKKDIKDWSKKVLEKLGLISDLDNDQFIFLAGERYRKFLVPGIKRYDIPMKGLGIGKQLKWLTDRNSL